MGGGSASLPGVGGSAGSLPSLAAWDAMTKTIGVTAWNSEAKQSHVFPLVPASQGRRRAPATKKRAKEDDV